MKRTAIWLLPIVCVTLSSCANHVSSDPFYGPEFYMEKEYALTREILTVKDAAKEIKYLKKELKRLKAKIKSLSPYK